MSKRQLVLIVEDDAWLAQQQARTLQAAGYDVQIADHGIAAIDMIDSRLPAVIVLDVFLSGPDGFALLHELRSHADLASIPVILCTSSADMIAEEDVATYGVQRLLDKTVMTPTDLVAAVRKVLL